MLRLAGVLQFVVLEVTVLIFSRVLLILIGLSGVLYFAHNAWQNILTDADKAGYDRANSECTVSHTKALLAAKQQELASIKRQLELSDQTVRQLRQDKAETARLADELQKEINYVTEHWTPPGKTSAEPAPACVFTHGFVRVYNSAIGATNSSAANMSATVRTTGAVGAASTTQTPDPSLQPSNVGRADILQHITDYGQQCQDTSNQLNRLIDYLQSQPLTRSQE